MLNLAGFYGIHSACRKWKPVQANPRNFDLGLRYYFVLRMDVLNVGGRKWVNEITGKTPTTCLPTKVVRTFDFVVSYMTPVTGMELASYG